MKETCLYKQHVALNAKLVSFANYKMPIRYTSEKEEHLVVKSRVGIFDVSHMGEFLIEGYDAKLYLQYIQTNDINKLNVGKAFYTCLTNENGGVVDDLLVYCLAKNSYMLVVNATNIEKDWIWLNDNIGNFQVILKNKSHELGLLAIQGPLADKFLNQFVNEPINSLASYNFITTNIGEIENVIISKTGYTGCGGYELYVSNNKIEKLWNLLLNEDNIINIKPIGLAARDTLRLEAGYCLYGNELNEFTSPMEAGLGWITKLNTVFIGSETLKKQKKLGIKQKLIALQMLEKAIPRKDFLISDENGKIVGRVTSGTLSPSLNVGIALGYVARPFPKVGDIFFIAIRKRNFRAKVIKLPFTV